MSSKLGMGLNHVMNMIKYVIVILLYMYLIVDSIAGFLVSRHLPNIGQVYKFFVIFLMMIYMIGKKQNIVMYLSFLFFMMFIIILNFIFSDFVDVIQSLLIMFKTISIFVFYEFFQKEIEIDKIDRIFFINYIVFVLNIFAGVLGFGNGSYSYNAEIVGTTGFFYAGNEVTFTFICLTFWFLVRYNMKKYLKYGLSILLSVMIGTKSGMLATLLLIFFDVFYSTEQKKRVKIIFWSLITLVLIVFFVYSFMQDNVLYQLISFKLKQHSRGDHPILNALLSGRIERFPIIQEIYEKKLSISTFLFGIGFPNHVRRIEMDFFEYFFYFGFVAFIILVLFYLNILYVSWKKNNKKQFWFNLICILISFLAGHIVYSVMGGVFFAMINSKLYREECSEKKIKRKRIRDLIFVCQYSYIF